MHVFRFARGLAGAGLVGLVLYLVALVLGQAPVLMRAATLDLPQFPAFQRGHTAGLMKVPCARDGKTQLRFGTLDPTTGSFAPVFCYRGVGRLDVRLTGITIVCSGPYSGSLVSSENVGNITKSGLTTNFVLNRCFSVKTPATITRIEIRPTIAQVVCKPAESQALLKRVGGAQPVCFKGYGSLDVSLMGVSAVCGGPYDGAVYFRNGKSGGWINFSADKCTTFKNPLYITTISL